VATATAIIGRRTSEGTTLPLIHQSIEITPHEAHALATAGEGLLVDVREPWEWSAGYAEGAELIPLHQIPAHADRLRDSEPVLFICASGNRSYQAAEYLRQLGLDARTVAGGTAAWRLHRLPIAV
jgi:rhodanese-related sulfurtransferase